MGTRWLGEYVLCAIEMAVCKLGVSRSWMDLYSLS